MKRALVALAVGVAVGLTLWARTARRAPLAGDDPTATSPRPVAEESVARTNGTGALPSEGAALPRLLEFSAGHCTACKLMEPILRELQRELEGRLAIETVDIVTRKAEMERYDVRIIPTQIFLAPDGRELFRNEGFMSKEDIRRKWAELGYSW